MNALESVIAQEIRSRGSITVARFMELALYHPEFGYYIAGPPRSGWRGHFLTSAELDGAFGELWTRGFEDVWRACDRPDRFDLIEIGPGEGGFAEAVLSAAGGDFARALHYHLVEPSGALRARQAARLERFPRTSWCASIDELPAVDAGCVFANEVLDNQPVRVVERRGDHIYEVLVELGDGGFALQRVPAAPDLVGWLDRAGLDIRPGGRGEVGQTADRLVEGAARRLGHGALIVCDYGMTGEEAAQRPGGTIACYSQAGVDDDFLAAPGTKDITSHVNWTAVERSLEAAGLSVAGIVSQRNILKRLGIDDLQNKLRRHAERGGAEAVRALSRRQALGILTDPGGLGAIGVLVAVRGLAAPRWATEPAGRGGLPG